MVLNGDDSAITMSVFSGGILAGTGTLDPNLRIISGGTLAPGPVGGIGTMTITGNLQLLAGSTYQVTIAPTSNVKDARQRHRDARRRAVQVAPLAGTYGPHTYTILTDTGGTIDVGNSFAGSVTSTRGVLVDPVLSYDADDVYLTIQGVLFTLNVPANAPTNVQNVANAIDQCDYRWRHAAGRLPEPVQLHAGATRDRAHAARGPAGDRRRRPAPSS